MWFFNEIFFHWKIKSTLNVHSIVIFYKFQKWKSLVTNFEYVTNRYGAESFLWEQHWINNIPKFCFMEGPKTSIWFSVETKIILSRRWGQKITQRTNSHISEKYTQKSQLLWWQISLDKYRKYSFPFSEISIHDGCYSSLICKIFKLY